MGRVKRKFLIVAGLFISGLNPLWATSSQTINSKTRVIDESNKNRSQNKQGILYELSAPNNLSLPTRPRDVLVKTFQNVNIDQLENILINNNRTIKVYLEKIDQAKSILRNSLSLWYPTLNLTANGIPQYFESNNYNESSLIQDTSSKQWSSSISAQIKWDLINPARVPEITAARDSLEKAKHTYSIVLRDLKLEAKKRYFNLQKANEEIEVANKSLESSALGLRDAEIRFESGIGTKLEVLEAKTQLARDQQLLNIKLGDQKIGQRSLAEILNFPEDVTPLIGSKTKVIGIWDLSLEDSIIAAYNAREELDNILLDISINENNANAALAAGKPKISIVNTATSSFAKGELNKISPNTSNTSSSFSNTIGLNATWFIFDGGSSRSLYNYNKSKSKEAKLNFALKRAQIRKEVEEVFFKLESAKLNISASYIEVLSARESLRLAQLRYKSGITTQREVVNNQRDLTDSEVRYIISVTSYNSLLADLSRQTGLENIKPCDIKVNQQHPQNEIPSNLQESNLIPLCQI
ncbi:TolC family protein [Prochlorococcus marinus]|uniref:TolC family protein n=1 Tax=Prochlorococcus marinus XMU1408 TaxID=2213228 RepID=A0A318R706_PROMR|nr:TolC family protein [Prochlorococcus marinus]MBW3041159.1 TolC family protein [Prochlorococcus marinus str. XMU1408]PYE03757.1 TolC family protein [Prochlorococcus marinus XMU1408]